VRAEWCLLCRLRAWPEDALPDPLKYPSRLAWGNMPVDAGALPGRCRLLAGRAFATLPGADPAAPALLAAMGARVRACAGPAEAQAGGAEVLVLARGEAAPAEAVATDVARVLVRAGVCRGSGWVSLGPMGIVRVPQGAGVCRGKPMGMAMRAHRGGNLPACLPRCRSAAHALFSLQGVHPSPGPRDAVFAVQMQRLHTAGPRPPADSACASKLQPLCRSCTSGCTDVQSSEFRRARLVSTPLCCTADCAGHGVHGRPGRAGGHTHCIPVCVSERRRRRWPRDAYERSSRCCWLAKRRCGWTPAWPGIAHSHGMKFLPLS